MELSVFQSSLLGLIQGMAEFLPISSSGHLVLAPWLFDFPDPGLAFDVALHVGTLLAVISFFWRDWLFLIRKAFGFRAVSDASTPRPYGRGFFWFLVAATVPGVIAGLLLEKQAETVFRHPLLIAGTLAGGGLLLLFFDRFAPRQRGLEAITLKEALYIGCAQALAIVPGVSRSGITITVARALGLDRASAARFSFLLSTPIIFGAAALHWKDLFIMGWNPVLLVGIMSSAVSGYLAIKYLIRFVERTSYQIFFWYRLALALIIVILFFI